MLIDLNIMVKAAEVAVRSYRRRPPSSAAGRLKVKKAGLSSTIGIAARDISPHVDIMKHLSGAVGHGAEELAAHYKHMHTTPSHIVGQAALSHGAALPARGIGQSAQIVAKKTPTQAINPNAVLRHAANTVPQQVIQGAVQRGAPAMGTASLLDQLHSTPFSSFKGAAILALLRG